MSITHCKAEEALLGVGLDRVDQEVYLAKDRRSHCNAVIARSDTCLCAALSVVILGFTTCILSTEGNVEDLSNLE